MNGIFRRCVIRRSRPGCMIRLKIPGSLANRGECSSSLTTARIGCNSRLAKSLPTNRTTGNLQPVRATPQAVGNRNSSIIDNLAKRISSARMSRSADEKLVPSSSVIAKFQSSARKTQTHTNRERLGRMVPDGLSASGRFAPACKNNTPWAGGSAVPERQEKANRPTAAFPCFAAGRQARHTGGSAVQDNPATQDSTSC